MEFSLSLSCLFHTHEVTETIYIKGKTFTTFLSLAYQNLANPVQKSKQKQW